MAINENFENYWKYERYKYTNEDNPDIKEIAKRSYLEGYRQALLYMDGK